jgi:hypothetical protein
MGNSAPAPNDTFAKTKVVGDIHQIMRGLDLCPINLVGMDPGGMGL